MNLFDMTSEEEAAFLLGLHAWSLREDPFHAEGQERLSTAFRRGFTEGWIADMEH